MQCNVAGCASFQSLICGPYILCQVNMAHTIPEFAISPLQFSQGIRMQVWLKRLSPMQSSDDLMHVLCAVRAGQGVPGHRLLAVRADQVRNYHWDYIGGSGCKQRKTLCLPELKACAPREIIWEARLCTLRKSPLLFEWMQHIQMSSYRSALTKLGFYSLKTYDGQTYIASCL